jgi:hypothetical protein
MRDGENMSKDQEQKESDKICEAAMKWRDAMA